MLCEDKAIIFLNDAKFSQKKFQKMFQEKKKNYLHTKLSKLEKLRCEKNNPIP